MVGFLGGGEWLARWGWGFLAPGKTTIKELYGKNRRPPHLSVFFLFTQTQQLDAAESVA